MAEKESRTAIEKARRADDQHLALRDSVSSADARIAALQVCVCVCVCLSVGQKKVSLPEIRSAFEFVPGLFGIVLRGGYLYGAWPRTVLILIEFKFTVPEL